MNFITRLCAIAVASLASVTAAYGQATTFEADGVFYQLSGNRAVIIPPTDGSQYSGNFTFVPTVEYEGQSLAVYTSNSSMTDCAITSLTLAPGWEGHRSGTQFFRDISSLSRIDLKSASGSSYNGYSDMTLSLGNNTELIGVSTLIDGDATSLRIDKFEVYGPDGNPLRPFLIVEENGQRIYPDDDNIFRLGNRFYTDDNKYCGILILGGGTGQYNIVLLNVEVDGQVQTLRVEPPQAQGMPLVEADGLFFKQWINGPILMAAPEGREFPENTVIPESVIIDGIAYQLTAIDSEAFEDATFKTLTLQGTYPQTVYVWYCPQLETIQWLNNSPLSIARNPVLSTIIYPETPEIAHSTIDNCPAITSVDIPQGTTAFEPVFSGCENLASVTIPDGVTSLGGFANCPALTSITLPASVSRIGSLYSCSLAQLALPRSCVLGSTALNNPQAGLYDIEVVENAMDYVKVRINSNITDADGNTLPLAAWPYRGYFEEGINTIVRPDEDGIFTLNRSVYIGGYYTLNNRYAFCYDGSKGDYTLGLTPETIAVRENFNNLNWFVYNLPAYDSGVDDIPAIDSDGPVEYYNLQGMRVANPTSGIYIRRCGNKTSKVYIR